MIDFELSEMQDTVRQMVHWLAETEIRPIALEADRNHRIPDAFLQKCREMGISSGGLAKRYGGENDGVGEEKDKQQIKQTNRVSVIASEEMAWGDPAVIL